MLHTTNFLTIQEITTEKYKNGTRKLNVLTRPIIIRRMVAMCYTSTFLILHTNEKPGKDFSNGTLHGVEG